MATKSGKLRSYASYVKNAKMKINRDNIGSTFVRTLDDGSKQNVTITKSMIKKQISDLNKLQGSGTTNQFKKDFLKSKNWQKIRITSKSSNQDIRKALKNQKLYTESKARYRVEQARKQGKKMTLKYARAQVKKANEEFEGVGGSW